MLRRASDIQGGLTVHTIDGDIGRVDQLYFDDRNWVVRYFVVDTSSWRAGKLVLISPIAVTELDWEKRILTLSLTREQVRNSPDIDQHKPVSRQHEIEYSNYYGWPYYWSSPGLWGIGYQPSSIMMERAIESAQEHEPESTLSQEPGEPHLRSSREVIGYHIEAIDGGIGHVEDLLIDDLSWEVHQLVVDTRSWWHGKTVLVSPRSISRLDWAEAKVYVNLTQANIKNAAEFAGLPISRAQRPRVNGDHP